MRRPYRSAILLMLCCAGGTQAAQLNIDLPGYTIPVTVANANPGATLTLSGPNGMIVQRTLRASDGGRFNLGDAAPGDGAYHYRISVSPGSVATRSGNGSNGRAAGMTPLPSLSASEGSFRIAAGQLYLPRATATRTDAGASPHPHSDAGPGPVPNDQVIADDLIVQGSACLGFDCVNNESFGFDTLRLKENNTRIKFNDTSVDSFPATNWQLTANDSASGGRNQFSIEDVTAGTVPFLVMGSAPTNSIFVDSSGRLGLNTSTPVQQLHLNRNDTPAIRLEQNNAGGFTAQTWDIAGNEANFFVRDATNGSLLPFRIRPGAPTSSIDISAAGNVGFGTQSPGAKIDVFKSSALASPVPVLRLTNTDASVDAAQQDRFVVDSSGNVLARGTISQLSSRTAKQDFRNTDGQVLLAKLDKMQIDTWRYKGAPATERHLGPVAEDFHAAFGLGKSNRYIAPTDMAGVALASVKALQEEIKLRDQRIEQLQAQLQALEKRVDAMSH